MINNRRIAMHLILEMQTEGVPDIEFTTSTHQGIDTIAQKLSASLYTVEGKSPKTIGTGSKDLAGTKPFDS
jgi:hypothetical protein